MQKDSDVSPGTVLRAEGLDKRYGGIHALRDVDFDVRAGEVQGLVGENGAGKSTLIKMLSGAEVADSGEVTVEGRQVLPGDPLASLAAGISTVYQEPTLFGELTVEENIFTGREIKAGGRVKWKQQHQRAVELLEMLGLDPSLARTTVADLPVGEQQLVSIAKAFATDVKVLILDEPSAILADREIATLFTVVRRMRDAGTGVIYISHRLDELAQITDRVTVMRDGAVVASRKTSEVTTRQIAELMVGRELKSAPTESNADVGEPVLEVRNLVAGKALKDASFTLHRGEVLGVYGLVGSGAGDIARALYGVVPATSGEIRVHGEEISISSPGKAKAAGFTMAPGNRRRDGVFLDKSLTFNGASSHLPFFSNGLGIMKAKAERGAMLEMMETLSIKAPTPETVIGALSGGNQQKVVIARQLIEDMSVTILEEPTQGVDVGAQEEIHRLVVDIARNGGACLVISTDLEEIRHIADRILVMYGGHVGTELSKGAPAAELLAAASGDSAAGPAGAGGGSLEPGEQR